MAPDGYGDGSEEDEALHGGEVLGDGYPAAKRRNHCRGGEAQRHARKQRNREEEDEVRFGFAGGSLI